MKYLCICLSLLFSGYYLTADSSEAHAQDDAVNIIVNELITTFKGSPNGSLAILPVLNESGASSRLGMSLTGDLQQRFIRKSRFSIIERARLEVLLEEQRLSLSGLTENQIKIGQIQAAQYILTGDLSKIENFFILSCRIIHTESSRIVAAAKIKIFSNPVLSLKHERILSDKQGKAPTVPTEILIEFKIVKTTPEISGSLSKTGKNIVFGLKDILSAKTGYNENYKAWDLFINFNTGGSALLRRFTSMNIGNEAAIFIDREKYFSGIITSQINNGQLQLTGIKNREDAKSIERIING